MNAQNDNAASARTGMRRLISSWEFRHLRACSCMRLAIAVVLAGAGIVMLADKWGRTSSGRDFFRVLAMVLLAAAALNLLTAFWGMTISRSAPPRT